MTTIIGIDPGKTTGFAEISVDSRKITLGHFGSTKDTTLLDIKDRIEGKDVVVYEAWLTRPGKLQKGAFDWDPMIAPQVIGALLVLCRSLEIPHVAKQQPSQKVPGYAFANLRYQKGKQGQHWQDALAHAVYYAVTRLQALPVGKAS